MFSPGHLVAIDLADTRLEAAEAFGADLTLNNAHADAVQFVREVTGGLGADVAIEAAGVPATLHPESPWTRDVTITTGLVDAYSTPTLLPLVATRQIEAARFVTHRFPLERHPACLRRLCPPGRHRRDQGRHDPPLTRRAAAALHHQHPGKPHDIPQAHLIAQAHLIPQAHLLFE